MTPSPFAYVAAFVEELVRSGLRHVCFSPGSRSTPLVMAMADHPEIRLWRHLDERSAAYFALGVAKALDAPTALVCTSGTAAANFLPAVVEAFYSRVPLVVITADRPPQAQGIGAPQTIDQLKLYGAHVKWFLNMPQNGVEASLEAYAGAIACKAVADARAFPAGPVHINFPFQEPLAPDGPVSVRPATARRAEARVQVTPGMPRLEREAVRAIAEELAEFERGVIICGPQDDARLGPSVARLANALDFPVLADPLSQVRSGVHDASRVIDAYDALLRDPRFVTAHAPDVIVRFGGASASKPLMEFIANSESVQFVVDPSGWNDPQLSATHFVRTDPIDFCERIADAAASLPVNTASRSAYRQSWTAFARTAREAIQRQLTATDKLVEGRVFWELADLLPEGSTVFVGNSMPVRDLDSFFPAVAKPLTFMANRGANGIDGVVSTALGAAAAAGRPFVLVIGDISFFCDMNALLTASLGDIDATIVLVNNDGGGIFSFLPQAAHPRHFETLFGSPHGHDFKASVEAFGAAFQRATGASDFRALLGQALGSRGLCVIEAPSDRNENVAWRRNMWDAVSKALSRHFNAEDQRP